jgi:SAM-dependent methyltransferase
MPTRSDASNEWFDANRAMWDERVPIHVSGSFYDVDGFRAGRDTLERFEVEEMGDIRGRELVHLQCHFGLDTLSWARYHGAKVAGLDFSGPAVEAAQALAAELAIEATFVQSNVYDAAEALGGRDFDVVYTGLGALNWLPDVPRWAGVVSGLVRPGGFLYLAEFHPLADVFGDDGLDVTYDYFHTAPKEWDDPGTYADLAAQTRNNRSFEWTHPIGEVVSALIREGLVLEFLHEHDYTLYPRWPFLEELPKGEFRPPAGMPSLPLMYSLRAQKPA